MKEENKKTTIKIVFLLVMVLVPCLIGILEYKIMNDSRILKGVYVENVYLGGETKKEAKTALSPLFVSSLKRQIKIIGVDKEWFYSPSQLGVKPNYEKIIKQAWQVGRRGYLWKRWWIRWHVRNYSVHLPLTFDIDRKIVKKTVDEISKSVNVEQKDAVIEITKDNKVQIIPEIYGRKVDSKKNMEELEKILKSFQKDHLKLKEVIQKPKLLAKEVEKWEINGVISSFETNFNAENKERSDNMKIAAKALDKKIIMPKEVFSFNNAVGPRTAETGYKESLIIENNRFIPGIGGGVCQVSTTLYNAVLRANLPIVERYPHSLPITYVSPGLDATVAYNLADLKFTNIYPKPLLIHTEYLLGRLRILIFGTIGTVPEVRITSKILKYFPPKKEVITDPSVPFDSEIIEEKGQNGMEVEVKREIIINGKVVSKEIVSRDKYKSQKSVVRVSPVF